MLKKILVTGANGFVGRNLCVSLAQRADIQLFPYDADNTPDDLEHGMAVADVIFHLAGVNRPDNPEDFKTGNADFTKKLCDSLLSMGRTPLIVLSSSIQAALDNPYGVSKRQAELVVEDYAQKCAAHHPSSSASPRRCISSSPFALIYRFPNVFGKWCRPNYNSAVATWCHNIAHDLPINVRDPDAQLTLVYIDDVINEFLNALNDQANELHDGYCAVPVTYTRTLGQITRLLYAFHASRTDLLVSDQDDGFAKKLYATYLSYLSEEQFSYPLKMNVDARGCFTEFIRTRERGQVSVNISKPGITKGNHWHHTKVEKFLVVSGKGVIRFRRVEVAGNAQRGGAEAQRILEYPVSGEKLEVVDIPPGYTHNIENLGDTDMVTVMWASELFDPERPDTFFEKV
jgi:UDP-2-acetamido-2,6-beta-L-arabino-hexul-4-ose reductase